jgi:hypothetical protein
MNDTQQIEEQARLIVELRKQRNALQTHIDRIRECYFRFVDVTEECCETNSESSVPAKWRRCYERLGDLIDPK